jgi:5-deoxy-glucuronate isomerase
MFCAGGRLYPLQFVAAENVEGDEKLHFVVGADGARREISILLGSNIQAGRLIVGLTRSRPGNWTSWPPHEHAAMLEEIYVYVDMNMGLRYEIMTPQFERDNRWQI